MQLDVERSLTRRNAVLAGVVLRSMCRSLRTYQPVLLDGRQIGGGRRESEGRVDAILDVLARYEADSVLDLGCAEGYFVRRCAEAGYLSVGVDADVRRLLVAQWSLTLDGVSRFGFIREHLDAHTIAKLPVSDVTLSLSVLHHVMYEHGVEEAREQLAAIRSITRKATIIEIGQSDEIAFPWASSLPDMAADPHGWMTEFIASAGFREVTKLTEAPAYNSDVKRGTFLGVV